MFKNFLWFVRKPVDERESALLSAAYQRALVVLWFGIIAIWFIAKTSLGESFLSSYGFAVVLGLLVLGSIIGGWSTLRDETLEYKKIKINRSPSIIIIGLLTILLFAACLGLVFLSANLLWIAMISFTIGELVIGAVATWRWTNGYTIHARLLGSFIFPFWVLGYMNTDKKGWRMGYAAISAFCFMVAPIFASMLILASPSHSFVGYLGWSGGLAPGIADTQFHGQPEPRSHKAILDYRDTDITVGDIVQYNKLEKMTELGGTGKTFTELNQYNGRVTAINGDSVTVDAGVGYAESVNSATPDTVTFIQTHDLQTVKKSDIVATIITDAPGAALAEKLLW